MSWAQGSARLSGCWSTTASCRERPWDAEVTGEPLPQGSFPRGQLPVSCNRDCGAGCPLVAFVEGGRLVRIADNPLRPRGMAGCPRGYRMPRVVYHPERLTRPLRRTGPRGAGQFREISWEEALAWV
ncbi:MAG: molybdopterin-dependent oxidoreductase, partial [Spirochaetales bacterium]|nr:molybdopterin-dependent oxidoreductase [Spirochaetales bacterium]